jgi:Domain of unknown function (DUF397)
MITWRKSSRSGTGAQDANCVEVTAQLDASPVDAPLLSLTDAMESHS